MSFWHRIWHDMPAFTARSIIVMILLFGALAGLLVALVLPDPASRIAIQFAIFALLGNIVIGLSMGFAQLEELQERKHAAEAARHSAKQIEELFAMTDMLQAADAHDDAGAVLMATAHRLLPDFGGALYVFNNSRDRLDLAKSWNTGETFEPSDVLLPANCWALKRGKPHINDPATATLCCAHHTCQTGTVEIPMMARGKVHGLLVLAFSGEESFKQLMAIRRLGRALADSMSLALSNISLREKLRSQSLRDPLTGLYNRRYMEDALDRDVSLAQRTGNATSVLMIDLDNFKQLNDVHGHAKGDAVLRDIAGQLVGALRPSDVVCRFGGEELLVILPNCDLDGASIKAEALRARIEALSEPHGHPISASFGVASIPETATSAVDVIPLADAALYVAKQEGKNCVRLAERRSSRDEMQLRLAVI